MPKPCYTKLWCSFWWYVLWLLYPGAIVQFAGSRKNWKDRIRSLFWMEMLLLFWSQHNLRNFVESRSTSVQLLNAILFRVASRVYGLIVAFLLRWLVWPLFFGHLLCFLIGNCFVLLCGPFKYFWGLCMAVVWCLLYFWILIKSFSLSLC